ncbi:MAG: hypothetical protein ACKO32_00625, partial [Planctomycetia bacterium]
LFFVYPGQLALALLLGIAMTPQAAQGRAWWAWLAAARLVRRNWGHSKLAARQADHNWIYTGYRNFVRPITNRCVDETPASRLGLVPRLYTLEEAIAWRGRLAI